jgi:TolB-like protein/DNA-binding winged helix-turn-helix (wHTH) protein
MATARIPRGCNPAYNRAVIRLSEDDVDGNFRVGSWFVEPSLNTISCNGTTVRLERKQVEVLVCLARNPGELVSKERLLHTVWPDTFVGDDVLIRAICELRRVFEDDPKDARFIQTIPKRGYRLVALVQPANGLSAAKTNLSPPVTESSPIQTTKKNAKLKIFLAGNLALVVMCSGLLALNVAGSRDLLFDNHTQVIKSLAVLPLQNLNGDPSQEYLADGMTEELITELSQISALRVISRTSVMRYKGSKKSLPEIAHELGTDGIVEGSVLRSGNKVRITAQLIYAPQDTNLWAETYDRDLGNVLALQSEIANTIASAVKIKSTPQEKERLKSAQPVNVTALEAYLQGEYHLNRYGRGFGEDEDKAAISYFQQAIAAEPGFARAYVELASAYEGLMLPANKRWPMERAATEKALALAPNLAEAHFTMGRVRLFSDWDFPAAGREFQRAIELNPNNAEAHDWYALYLSSVGRDEEAKAEGKVAQQLDPVHYLHDLPGDEDRGIILLQNYLELNPEDGYAHMDLANRYARNGMQKEHVGELEKTAASFGFPTFAKQVAAAYSRSGYQGALRTWAEGLDRNGVNRPMMVAETYVRLGDKDKALHWLERAYSEHDDDMVCLKVDSVWDPLRSEPRFKELLRGVGLQ